jgi:transcription initiation factor IIE alpha subunit
MKNQKNKELSEYLKVLMEFNNDHNYFRCKSGLKELVAANPKTPSDILDLLIEDEYSDTYIKTRVANNPNTSLETLFKLSKNRSWDVKHRVFDHFKWKGPECEEIRRVQRGW